MAALISPEIGTVTNQAMKMFLNRRQSTDFLERSQPTATTEPTCHHMRKNTERLNMINSQQQTTIYDVMIVDFWWSGETQSLEKYIASWRFCKACLHIYNACSHNRFMTWLCYQEVEALLVELSLARRLPSQWAQFEEGPLRFNIGKHDTTGS